MNTPTPATPKNRANPGLTTGEFRLPLSVTRRVPCPAKAAQGYLCCTCHTVLTDAFAPKLKRGDLVYLTADVEPHAGDVVAVAAPHEPGFTLAWHEPGQEVQAVAVGAFTSYHSKTGE